MMKATFDTNVLPAQALLERARERGVDATTISVSAREVEGSSLEAEVSALEKVLEVAVFNESRFGEAVFGSEADGHCLETALVVLSNGSFPSKDHRDDLSPGHRRQLRDAMILCAHLRDKRDILVSNDLRAFINAGRRELIEATFRTRVMTVREFEEYLDSIQQ